MAKGKKRPAELPEYGTVMMKGVQYYRTRITDADGKRVAIYGLTREELYDRVEDAQKKIAEVVFHRENPTVEEYCEKWLLMRSGTVRTNTLEGYERMVNRYIVGPIGQMYMDEVTTDDLRLLMVPLSKGSSGMYGQLNMLIKNIFNSAEESKVIKENPSKTICARGGKPAKRREALTDEQTAILLDSIRELPPYVFVMIGLYAGLRREEILGLKWDCVFLDEKNAVHFRKACMACGRRCAGSQHTFEDSGSEARCSDSQMPGSLSQGSKGKIRIGICDLEFEGNCFDGNTVCEGLEVHNSSFYCRTLLLHLCKWTVHQA